MYPRVDLNQQRGAPGVAEKDTSPLYQNIKQLDIMIHGDIIQYSKINILSILTFFSSNFCPKTFVAGHTDKI